jgi:hypothetical protein
MDGISAFGNRVRSLLDHAFDSDHGLLGPRRKQVQHGLETKQQSLEASK